MAPLLKAKAHASATLEPPSSRRPAHLAILLAIALLGTTRCATIAHGTTEPIHVESDPPGAVVSLNCVEGSITNAGTTPVTIDVLRKSKSCAFEIAKEGYIPA